MTLKEILQSKKFRSLRDVAIFMFLLLSFHFLYRFWAYHLHFAPIADMVNAARDSLAGLLYKNSVWALQHLTGYDFTFLPDKREIWYVPGRGYVGVHLSCSGFKQMLQWAVLMLFFPGPWKHKLWFIPLGLLITHMVNIFRISGLSVVLIYVPQHWQFIHDDIYRPFFYVVMFLLWVWWVEKFRNKARKSNTGS